MFISAIVAAAAMAFAGTPVNTTCPMTGKTVGSGSPVVTIDGSDVAVCCRRCLAKVNAMDDAGKKAILAKYAPSTPPAPAQELVLAKVFLLPTCPISNEGMDAMGEAATKVFDGREIMVCCAPCFKHIDADPEKYRAKIDAQIVKRQLKTYPLDTCIVSGRPLGKEPVNMVYGNRLVRMCCTRCAAAFKKEPVGHLKALDVAMLAKAPAKPADICIVSGRPVGASDKAVVIANRVIRTCCGNCLAKVIKAPRAWVTKLDARAPAAPAAGS